MTTHMISTAAVDGFVNVMDMRTGRTERVYVGALASQLSADNQVQPAVEPPAQKWCSVIAA